MPAGPASSLSLRDERGFALVVALIVLGAITLGALLVLSLAGAGGRESAYSRARVTAFNLAEQGMNAARSTLWSVDSSQYLNPGNVPLRTVTADQGTIEYYGALDGTVWTLTGVATVANPNGGEPITRIVRSKVGVVTGQVPGGGNEVWDYLYHDNPATCFRLENNVSIAASIYSRGNLCLENSSQITGGKVQVLGSVSISHPAGSIGTAAAPIEQVHVLGGCRYRSNPVHSPCGPADHVYAQSSTASPVTLTKPPADFDYWYANADLGPGRYCTVGSFPGGPAAFDNNGVRDGSVPQVELTPAIGYDCRRTDASGRVVAQLTWTPGGGNTPGALIVKGTIFFDGYLVTRANRRAAYQGLATIYASQRITIENQSALCGTPACDASWDPNANRLILVAGSSENGAVTIQNNTDFQGGVYCVGDFVEENNARVWGPVIADEIMIQNHAHHEVHFSGLIPGQPGHWVSVPMLQDLAGGWIG